MSNFRLNTPPGAIRKELEIYLSAVSNKSERKRILNAGAVEVRNEARKQEATPKWKKESHYFYPKKAGGRITVYAGNLRKSMAAFGTRDGDVEVGPKIRRGAKLPEVGRTVKTASAFYAAWIFGSASAFRQQVMEPALNNAKNRAFAAIVKKYTEVHKKVVK